MQQPASFEQEIDGHLFTFARICTDEEPCDQYSVMCEESILRMSREQGTENYVLSYTENVPEFIISLEDKLSDCIRGYEANESHPEQP